MEPRRKAIVLLLLVTLVWGFTFPLIKLALAWVPPLELGFARFALATLALAFVVPWRSGISRDAVRGGVLGGLALAAVYVFALLGIAHTTSTNAGLINGLYVVLTPIFTWALRWTRMQTREWVGAVVGFVGLVLLSGLHLSQLRQGDAWMVASAVVVPCSILLMDAYLKRVDFRTLVFVQFATVTLCLGIVSALTERWTTLGSPTILGTLAFLGLVGTVFCFLAQAWAQKRVRPTQVAVIFNMETVFATIVSQLAFHEPLTVVGWVGASLILASMFVAASAPRTKEPTDHADLHASDGQRAEGAVPADASS